MAATDRRETTVASIVTGEWRVTIPKESLTTVKHEHGLVRRAWLATIAKVAAGEKMVAKIASDDPRKVVHAFKVGITLALVSLFYYLRPLYDGVGGTAMWAVMTVVVIFEYTAGGTLYKGLNRAAATLTAGALGVGIHWFASKAGHAGELIILNGAVFILASVVSFSRFFPAIKRQFDYGATIFILTFCLVAVSGYRVDELVVLAQERLSTVCIGIAICLIVSMLICPVWAGGDLHRLTAGNADKLADSLEGSVEGYFDGKEAPKAQGFKCVLNSKALEDSLVNLARWEPGHGPFSFRHPWSQYKRLGDAMRNCAFCIEALYGCLTSEIQAPELMKKRLSDACLKLSSNSAKALRETAACIRLMERSKTLECLIGETSCAAAEVKRELPELLPAGDAEVDHQLVTTKRNHSLIEAMPLVAFASILAEIPARVKGVAEELEKLADLAGFKAAGERLSN
ncbi:Aluminum-activated malate transporter 10 [Apostasia shenzhenica]|uniref:Aluminum-activated malate transporter 10 n=1 Tax=Apostasia shenzhenica TaxID=1088818 RepID=A0A2I0AL79_9ASPA|nr:Aluminum-activated malate transporter 10 [Apostasia shenzhenica]